MRLTVFKCDRCNKPIEEDSVTKVDMSHGRGKFDLRDEDFELCPQCDEDLVEWIRGKS